MRALPLRVQLLLGAQWGWVSWRLSWAAWGPSGQPPSLWTPHREVTLQEALSRATRSPEVWVAGERCQGGLLCQPNIINLTRGPGWTRNTAPGPIQPNSSSPQESPQGSPGGLGLSYSPCGPHVSQLLLGACGRDRGVWVWVSDGAGRKPLEAPARWTVSIAATCCSGAYGCIPLLAGWQLLHGGFSAKQNGKAEKKRAAGRLAEKTGFGGWSTHVPRQVCQ